MCVSSDVGFAVVDGEFLPVQAHRREQQRIRERVVSLHRAFRVEVCGWGLSHVQLRALLCYSS